MPITQRCERESNSRHLSCCIPIRFLVLHLAGNFIYQRAIKCIRIAAAAPVQETKDMKTSSGNLHCMNWQINGFSSNHFQFASIPFILTCLRGTRITKSVCCLWPWINEQVFDGALSHIHAVPHCVGANHYATNNKQKNNCTHGGLCKKNWTREITHEITDEASYLLSNYTSFNIEVGENTSFCSACLQNLLFMESHVAVSIRKIRVWQKELFANRQEYFYSKVKLSSIAANIKLLQAVLWTTNLVCHRNYGDCFGKEYSIHLVLGDPTSQKDDQWALHTNYGLRIIRVRG